MPKTLLIALLIALFPRDAAAYLDPGTGSLIFQIVIGSVLAVGVSLKMTLSRMFVYFKSKNGRDGQADGDRIISDEILRN